MPQKHDEPRVRGTSDEQIPPSCVYPGSRLVWDSPLQEIVLLVELPFWLLMPSRTVCISVGGLITDVHIDNDGVEIQLGHQFTRTHRNTVFIGGRKAASEATAPAMAIPSGGIYRATRTLLSLNTCAIADALDAFFGEDGPRFQDGVHYFASLAQSQLPVINKVINSYRMASVDPFAYEVTASDVPVWFVRHAQRSNLVYLNSYVVEDWFPSIRQGLEGEDHVPYFAVSGEAVEQQLMKGELPGEIEMLDGWSLFHRGRFGDSIRSFVTAIEVLVEAEIRRLLANSGHSEEAIDSRIDSTRNNFDKRLLDYSLLSKRRIPGPILHMIPYVNGVRLAEEFDQTRRLRHKIVHNGHRLDHTFSKLMFRAAETTSWLFDWLSNNGDFERRRGQNSSYFFGLRTSLTPFECDVRDGRMVVLPFVTREVRRQESTEKAVMIESADRVVHNDNILLRTINRRRDDGKDVEHFVKMAFYELGAGELEDSPFEISPHPIAERFRLHIGDKCVLIFVLDTSDPVAIIHLNSVNAYLTERKENGEKIDHAILVANAQNDRDWFKRAAICETTFGKLASDSGITVVSTSDVARLLLGGMKYHWSLSSILNEMLLAGVFKSRPPASQYLGEVYHFWSRPMVVGVQTTGACGVKDGDVVAIQLHKSFHQLEINEPKIDDAGRLTFTINTARQDVPIASPVYVLDRQLSFHQNPEVNRSHDNTGFGRMFVYGAVHPSRDSTSSPSGQDSQP